MKSTKQLKKGQQCEECGHSRFKTVSKKNRIYECKLCKRLKYDR